MEKINIAELLKNCPKGMELDCILFNNPVTLDEVADIDEYSCPITVTTVDGDIETFTKYGQYFNRKDAKCIIFPKGKTSWEGFQRPFKDGDIVAFDNPYRERLEIFIFKNKKENNTLSTCYLMLGGNELYLEEDMYYVTRFATEDEKQKLFDAIKANGYKWNPKNKTLEKLIEPYKEETMENKLGQITLDIPDGYEFFGINDDNKVVLTKIQPQYPKTYEECCRVVNANSCIRLVYNLSDGQKYSYDVDNLQRYENMRKLLICRDAYWKIVGEEMGLGKPWKPDWGKADEKKYCIVNTEGNITHWVQKTTNKILAFPTEEMRDAFYENFKDLIEECKELL